MFKTFFLDKRKILWYWRMNLCKLILEKNGSIEDINWDFEDRINVEWMDKMIFQNFYCIWYILILDCTQVLTLKNSKKHCSYYILKVQHPWSSMQQLGTYNVVLKYKTVLKIIFMKKLINEKMQYPIIHYINI